VIVSVLFLIGLFLCISAYLILTGLNFIGLSYLLVYIGAVMKPMIHLNALVRVLFYNPPLNRRKELVTSHIRNKKRSLAIFYLNNIKPKLIPARAGVISQQELIKGNI
jgi:NADH:ubiquinone oxidoreductase subunit 6 (subunit J)